ncbi:Rab family, other [Angomonas deanei]|nr:Rab family, other [Angomonas deanei]|eukprot:EPY40093.1 Rab family, other [Angomonas deanei]
MHQMNYMDKRVRLQIWDTAGQERFQSVATAFYRGANGVMLCFDLTHRPSFQHLEQWVERVKQQALPGIPCLLIGCKSDEARANRQVTKEEAMQWAEQHGMGYMETSAKEKENVQPAFQTITKSIFEDMKDRNGKVGSAAGRNAGGREASVNLEGNKTRKKRAAASPSLIV